MRWSNGDFYRGSFIRGVKSGRGNITYGNGDSYEGEFGENLMHG